MHRINILLAFGVWHDLKRLVAVCFMMLPHEKRSLGGSDVFLRDCLFLTQMDYASCGNCFHRCDVWFTKCRGRRKRTKIKISPLDQLPQQTVYGT